MSFSKFRKGGRIVNLLQVKWLKVTILNHIPLGGDSQELCQLNEIEMLCLVVY